MNGVSVSEQDAPYNSRVREADKKAGTLNGEIWMDAVDELGSNYMALAKMYAPRPGDLEFNSDRARVASALRRYGMAKMLVFYDAASIELEKLEDATDPQERGNIILRVLRRSLDVSHPYIEYGWQALEAMLKVDLEDLRSELQRTASGPYAFDSSNLRQVGVKPTK
jgi:hypothetical protein